MSSKRGCAGGSAPPRRELWEGMGEGMEEGMEEGMGSAVRIEPRARGRFYLCRRTVGKIDGGCFWVLSVAASLRGWPP